MLHRQTFRKLSQNSDIIQLHCNDRRNPSHFACRKWYTYMNSNTNNNISMFINVQRSIISRNQKN